MVYTPAVDLVQTPVRLVATTNVAIATALEDGDTLDSLTLVENDVVLLTGQTNAAHNGLYTVVANGGGTAPRSSTAFTAGKLALGVSVYCTEGTHRGTVWAVTVAPAVLETDTVTFVKVQEAGVTASTGIAMSDTGVISIDTGVTADLTTTQTLTSKTLTSAVLTTPEINGTVTTASSITLPTFTAGGAIAMGTNKITGLGTPTAAQDAATKTYVDGVAAGLSVKDAVRAASTANVTLATDVENGDTMDGVVLATGDRILLKDQTTGSENGIYVVAASGAPSRSTDADADAEVVAGMFFFVTEGTASADTGWVVTTDGTITVDTTAITFTQFTGAGAVVAGDGLDKTGNTLSLDLLDDGGLVITSTELAVDVSGTAVTGALRIENGGTGVGTLETGKFMVGAGTGALTYKTAPAGEVVGESDAQTLTSKTMVAHSNKFFTITTDATATVAPGGTENEKIMLEYAGDVEITMPAITTTNSGVCITLVDALGNSGGNEYKITPQSTEGVGSTAHSTSDTVTLNANYSTVTMIAYYSATENMSRWVYI